MIGYPMVHFRSDAPADGRTESQPRQSLASVASAVRDVRRSGRRMPLFTNESRTALEVTVRFLCA